MVSLSNKLESLSIETNAALILLDNLHQNSLTVEVPLILARQHPDPQVLTYLQQQAQESSEQSDYLSPTIFDELYRVESYRSPNYSVLLSYTSEDFEKLGTIGYTIVDWLKKLR